MSVPHGPAAQEHRGLAADTGMVSAWVETNAWPTATTNRQMAAIRAECGGGRQASRWCPPTGPARAEDEPASSEQLLGSIGRSVAWATTSKTPQRRCASWAVPSPPTLLWCGSAAGPRPSSALARRWSSTGPAWRSVAQPPARSACAPPPCSRRNTHRAYVPLRTGDGPSVFAHRRAYPMLVGRAIQVDCRRRLGVRSFSCSLPPDLGLRTSFGRESRADRRDSSALGADPPPN